MCEYDRNCAGIIIQSMVVYGTPTNEVGPKSCKLIYGETKTGVFRRTVVRSDPSRLEIPTYLRGASGRMSCKLRGTTLCCYCFIQGSPADSCLLVVLRAPPAPIRTTTVCRELPDPVFHGTWPTSCRGTPVGGSCLARCDCDVEECYSRDGCPVTICQPDGNW